MMTIVRRAYHSRMPGWLKVILIVVGAFVLIIFVIGFVAYRSLQARAPELKAAVEKAQRDGAAFGAGKQPADCIDEALRRPDRTFTGMIRTRMFSEACFKASTQPPGYCDQVPSGIIDTAKWANAECARRKLAGDEACVQVYTAAGQYCHPSH